MLKKNKIFSLSAASLLCAALLSSAPSDSSPTYISPNNDGVQDNLEVSFRIRDKNRITGWSLIIEDAKGNVVRTIGNKIALPTAFNGKNFIKGIASKKQAVEVPAQVVWNGVMDNGETAPDGEYFYYITAIDERNNRNETKKRSVIVDNTPPSVTLSAEKGERIFGEGNKTDFKISQSGSKEDKWTAEIKDTAGRVVRRYEWEGEPASFAWNGTDDNGVIVADGIYAYSVTATDRAGNTAPLSEITNIIFSAEKPETNILITGSRYFSVPEKSKTSQVRLSLVIPEPRAGSGNALVAWSVDVKSKDGKIVRTYKGSKGDVPPEEIAFDGKDDSLERIADGEYYATVQAEYLNGFKTPAVNSPVFVFDTKGPSAVITGYDDIFSPDGDGSKDTFTLRQKIQKSALTPVRAWTGRISRAGSTDAVYEYKFGAAGAETVSWNGLDSSGALCPDGSYDYELFAEDAAGNSFSVKTEKPFTLDTSKTEVMLAASDAAFNPNGKRKSVTYTSVLKSSAVQSYNFEIKNKAGVTVYEQKGEGKVPPRFVWNGNSSAGRLCDDGDYFASLSIKSANGGSARADANAVTIDTVPPSANLSIENTVFSPDGDGRKDAVKVNAADSSRENEWHARVTDKNGEIVRTFDWSGKLGSFEWDGTDEAGNRAADGTYSLTVNAEDAAGNEFSRKFETIVLDTRPTTAYVTAALAGISPESKTGLTAQNFDVRLSLNEGIEDWSFNIVDKNGKSVRKLDAVDGGAASGNKKIPARFVWDGKDDGGNNAEGSFEGRLIVSYIKGNLVDTKSAPFICSVTPPALAVKTTPEFFSPDNDGTDDECRIDLTGKAANGAKLVSWSFSINNPESTNKAGAFWKTSGSEKITPQIVWDGLSNTSREKDGKAERVQSAMDYPYVFTATDSLGLTSTKTGVIPVDILVIRDGDALKMAVPSIIFRSNHADFKTAKEAPGSQVTEAQAANNVRVLKRVAEILKKFPDYTVTVSGHANRTGAAGEDEELLRLSAQRADFVKARLTEYGIPEKRLTSEGKGATEPVAAFSDTANWWKNRRVEFILHK